MKEYKFTVKRTYTQDVYDTYTIGAEDESNALEKIRAILSSPAEMAILPHDTLEQEKDKNYLESICINVKGDGIDKVYYNRELETI